MSTPYACILCWREAKTEMHHIAGRANHDRMIPLCIPCHQDITLEQVRRGMPLSGDYKRVSERQYAIQMGHAIIWMESMKHWKNALIADLQDCADGIPEPLTLFGLDNDNRPL